LLAQLKPVMPYLCEVLAQFDGASQRIESSGAA
jgi:hypothetical protein